MGWEHVSTLFSCFHLQCNESEYIIKILFKIEFEMFLRMDSFLRAFTHLFSITPGQLTPRIMRFTHHVGYKL